MNLEKCVNVRISTKASKNVGSWLTLVRGHTSGYARVHIHELWRFTTRSTTGVWLSARSGDAAGHLQELMIAIGLKSPHDSNVNQLSIIGTWRVAVESNSLDST